MRSRAVSGIRYAVREAVTAGNRKSNPTGGGERAAEEAEAGSSQPPEKEKKGGAALERWDVHGGTGEQTDGVEACHHTGAHCQ